MYNPRLRLTVSAEMSRPAGMLRRGCFFEVSSSGSARLNAPVIGGSVAQQPVSGTGIGRRREQWTIMQMRSAVRCHEAQLQLSCADHQR